MKANNNRKLVEKFVYMCLGIIAIGYIYVLCKIVLFKYGFSSDIGSINLRPFEFIKMFLYGTSLDVVLKNVLGNIAIFIPLGMYVAMILKRYKWMSVLYGMGISILFEVIQLVTCSGAADVDDVILNTMGVALGTFFYIYILGKLDKKVRMPVATLVFLVIFGFAGRMSLYLFAPNMLPAHIVYENECVFGDIDKETYDLSGICTGIVEDKLNFKEKSMTRNDEDYTPVDITECKLIEDTVLIIEHRSFQYSPNGNIQKIISSYSLVDRNELAECIKDTKSGFCNVWTDSDIYCKMIVYTVMEN